MRKKKPAIITKPVFLCFLKGLILHKRIFVAYRRNKTFLDGSRTYPPQQIQFRTRFVVGPRTTGTPKGLHVHNSSGGFIVDIEISCGMFQLLHHMLNNKPVLGKYLSRKGINGGVID